MTELKDSRFTELLPSDLKNDTETQAFAYAVSRQVQQVIRACTAQTPEIAAICATSFGEVVVPVDAAGHTLAEAMLYTNAAAQAQWKRLDEKLGGKRIHMITGHVSHSMYTISNLMRIRETEPEVYAKTAKFLFISSFINYRLTGVAATETSLAARSMAYDVCSGVWSSDKACLGMRLSTETWKFEIND